MTEKEGYSKQYVGQSMPPLTDADIKKIAYLERRRRESEHYRIAEETLFLIMKRNESVKGSSSIDVMKSEQRNQYVVDELVRKILRGK